MRAEVEVVLLVPAVEVTGVHTAAKGVPNLKVCPIEYTDDLVAEEEAPLECGNRWHRNQITECFGKVRCD